MKLLPLELPEVWQDDESFGIVMLVFVCGGGMKLS